MTTYAIGDVQGCFASLNDLLDKIHFKPDQDRLWFTGDLVNRGPQSLEVLRFVMGLGDQAITVLGNHDFHLLAIAAGHSTQQKHDTLEAVLAAPDRDQLLDWLRRRPLLHRDDALGYILVHAGITPQWSLTEAQQRAKEVETVLRSDQLDSFLANMYGNQPDYWQDDLSGWDRLRFITNVFARIRFCDAEGRLDMHQKGAPGKQPQGLLPWFNLRQAESNTIIFGHWSTLDAQQRVGMLSLDSGCLWGGQLTAARLKKDHAELLQVPCPAQQAVDDLT